jgi:hypothetical protein
MATQWYQAVHASKRFRLGTRKTDIAGNIYVYMKGVASLAAGDLVQYDENFVTTRSLVGSAVASPVAVSMAANTAATTFSWFQIYGIATVTSATVAADKQLQPTAVAGQVDDTTTAGKTIIGMISQAADGVGVAAGFVLAYIAYPYFEAAAIV